MSITRRFKRTRARNDRRQRRRARPGPEYVMATIPFGAGGPDSEPCECPICAYLATVEAPAETLEDGTVVHRLSEQELLEVQAMMSTPHADC